MFKEILVPLDCSEHSLHALEKAIKLAKKFDGKREILIPSGSIVGATIIKSPEVYEPEGEVTG